MLVFFPEQCHPNSTQSGSHSIEKPSTFNGLSSDQSQHPLPPLSSQAFSQSQQSSLHTWLYVLLSINCLIYSACKKMWSSSITCVVARLLCVCVCACVCACVRVWARGGCMHVGMRVLVYLCRSTEGERGREGEREKEKERERFVRHLYLQTTG